MTLDRSVADRWADGCDVRSESERRDRSWLVLGSRGDHLIYIKKT